MAWTNEDPATKLTTLQCRMLFASPVDSFAAPGYFYLDSHDIIHIHCDGVLHSKNNCS